MSDYMGDYDGASAILATGGFLIKLDGSGNLGFYIPSGTESFNLNTNGQFGGTGAIILSAASPIAVTGATAKFPYNFRNVATVGTGSAIEYGLDNRSGVTVADTATTTLYATTTSTTQVFFAAVHIDATAFSSGTATYTVTWTENAVTKTTAVSATALNTPATSVILIKPDASTNITGQLTGTFTATVTFAATLLEVA